MKQKAPATAPWTTLLAIILLLLGIYASARTVVNIAFFSKYPTEGVLSFNLSGFYPGMREEDCSMQQIYYDESGLKERPATPEEKKRELEQKQTCLSGVIEARRKAKINDISQSLLFLFLGAGILASKKLFTI